MDQLLDLTQPPDDKKDEQSKNKKKKKDKKKGGRAEASYFSAQAPPSTRPPRSFCAVCGFNDRLYTCVVCGMKVCFFFQSHIFTTISKYSGTKKSNCSIHSTHLDPKKSYRVEKVSAGSDQLDQIFSVCFIFTVGTALLL